MAAKAKMSPEKKLLAFAKRESKSCRTWIELHNKVYGIGGEFVRLFTTRSERTKFIGTPEYDAISELLSQLPRKANTDPKEGESSGKFVIRMSPTMHAALVAEADREGVSLNSLCVSKLALQMGALV